MIITTDMFGQIKINKDTIYNFPEGLLGFANETKFTIIDTEDGESPFLWLQSINSPELVFVIMNPSFAFPDYNIEIPKRAREKLEIEKEEDVAVYSILVVAEDMEKITANLSGPIILNINKRLGKQVILDDDRYSTKHYVFQQKTESRSG